MILTKADTEPRCACDTAEPSADEVSRIIESHRADRGALMSILEAMQTEFRHLPQSALRTVAESLELPLVEVYAAATFYHSFSLEPKGKHIACVCTGTACHVRGAPAVASEFERQLGIEAGQTTEDGEFTLETVNCVGSCALGPIVVADGKYHSKVSGPKVAAILRKLRTGEDDSVQDDNAFPIEAACPRCSASLMDMDSLTLDRPSIVLNVGSGGSRGRIKLSSLYGVWGGESDADIAAGELVDLLCPKCGVDLATSSVCPECSGGMAEVAINGGARLLICRRSGCSGHALDLNEGQGA